MRTKRVLKKLGIALLAVIIAAAVAAGALFAFYKPTVTFDASQLTGSVTKGVRFSLRYSTGWRSVLQYDGKYQSIISFNKNHARASASHRRNG